MYKEKAENVENDFREGLDSLERDIETERANEQQKLEDEANKIKKVRLAEYEARLKSARNKNEFAQILEEYQQAQKRVEAEISEQRDKQEKDINGRLKLRKQRKLAELERKKREATDTLKNQQNADTQTLKNEIEQLRLLVDLEEGALDDPITDLASKEKRQKASDALLERMKEDQMSKIDAL